MNTLAKKIEKLVNEEQNSLMNQIIQYRTLEDKHNELINIIKYIQHNIMTFQQDIVTDIKEYEKDALPINKIIGEGRKIELIHIEDMFKEVLNNEYLIKEWRDEKEDA